MHNELDPVDDALQSLRSETRSGIAPNREIEERLMVEFRQQHTPGGFRRYRSVAITLAVVLIGGVGFAATGGTEFVRQFVKVRLIQISGGQEGEVELEMMLEPDENGEGKAVATLGSIDGEQTTITLEQVPPELTDTGEEKTQITVSMQRDHAAEDVADQSATARINLVQLSPHDPSADDDAMTTFIIRNQDDGTETITLESLDEDAMIWDWVDDDGLDRELRLIPDQPDDEATMYTVLTALETDNNMKIYRTVGTFQHEGVVADVLDIFEDQDGSLILELVGDDGHRQTIELSGKTNDESRKDERRSYRLQRVQDDAPE